MQPAQEVVVPRPWHGVVIVPGNDVGGGPNRMDLSYAGRRLMEGHQGRKGNESAVNGGGSTSRPYGKTPGAGNCRHGLVSTVLMLPALSVRVEDGDTCVSLKEWARLELFTKCC